MVKKRLIFTLLINNGIYMLSRNFSLQKVGSLEWIREFYDFDAIASSIDELIVLNVQPDGLINNEFLNNVKKLSKMCFVPLSVGGGIRTIDDVYTFLNAGADKVVINTLLFESPTQVKTISQNFGKQCLVASIDYRNFEGKNFIYSNYGKKNTGIILEEFIVGLEDLNIGEIYLNSIARDGTGRGYDIETLEKVSGLTHLPIIAAGGAGQYAHLVDGIKKGKVDAVSTDNLFNFMADGLTESRWFMKKSQIDLANFGNVLDETYGMKLNSTKE